MTEAAARLDDTSADPPERALVMRFESLGGAGHGREFGLFQARRALALEPDDASYRASLGNMLRETGQRDEAEVALRAAVRLDPAEPRYLVLLSHLLRECGREDEALDAVAQAVALDPWSVDLRLDLAAMQEAKQDWAAAAGTLQTAISLDGPTADLCFRLALALMRLNRNQEALDAAHAGQDAEIGSPQLRQIRSECLLRCGRIKEALIEAYRAVVSNQRNGEAYAHLGHVLRAANDQTAAEQAWLRATEIEPSNARFRHELDVLRSQMHRPEDAILAARDAAERDPTNPSRWAHLAHVAASANAWQEAQSAQRKAAQLAPDDVDHQLILSDLFAREGRLQEALVEAQIAVDRVPDSGHALGHLAHIEQLMGNLAQAEERLQKAMRLAPGNDHLRQRHELLLARIVTEGSVATSRA